MNARWQIMFLVVLLILMAVVFAVSSQYSYIQAKLAPMTISGLLIILTAIQIFREYRSKKRAKTGTDSKIISSDNSERFPPFLIQSFWMIGFLLAIALFGVPVAIPLFIISYMRSHGILWRKSIFVSAVTLIIIHALFTKILEVNLYAGLIPRFLIG